jgi:hypothetical protein
MTTTLQFDRHDVQRVIEHMTTATEWGHGYDDDNDHEHDARPQLIFVKDQGIYLMSNGLPRDIVEGETSFVAYAEGYDPSVETHNTWDTVSRDDFGEFIDLTTTQIALIRSPKFRSLAIELDEHSFEIIISPR